VRRAYPLTCPGQSPTSEAKKNNPKAHNVDVTPNSTLNDTLPPRHAPTPECRPSGAGTAERDKRASQGPESSHDLRVGELDQAVPWKGYSKANHK